jgi:hypothetical protein
MSEGDRKDIELRWTPLSEFLNLGESMTEQPKPLRLKLGAHGLTERMVATVSHGEVLGLPKTR